MSPDSLGPILIVCADEALATSILRKLFDEGLSAVGPAPTAGLALALAAQTSTRTAIIAGDTTGRRTATELAAELRGAWGVDCYVLAVANEDSTIREEASSRAAGLARVLGAATRRAPEAPRPN